MERHYKHRSSSVRGRRLARGKGVGGSHEQLHYLTAYQDVPNPLVKATSLQEESESTKRSTRRNSFRLSWRRRKKKITEEQTDKPQDDPASSAEEKASVATRVRRLFGGSFRRCIFIFILFFLVLIGYVAYHVAFCVKEKENPT
eukprot:m.45867 g.45867  ORF g.45867 m.45867 type:complete len:144 (+) comp12208_c1_seq2:289-720(+)